MFKCEKSKDFTTYKLRTLSIEALMTKADSMSLLRDMFMIIGSIYAAKEIGLPYFVLLIKILPEIGSKITLLLIINPNLFQLASISIILGFSPFLLIVNVKFLIKVQSYSVYVSLKTPFTPLIFTLIEGRGFY